MQHGAFYISTFILVFIITNTYAPGIPLPLPPNRPHSPPWEPEPEELQRAIQLLHLKCIEVTLASRILEAGPPDALMCRAKEIMNYHRPLFSALADVLDWLDPMTNSLTTAVPDDILSPLEMQFAIWYHHLLALHLKWDMSVLEASTHLNQLAGVQNEIKNLWDAIRHHLTLKERLEEAVADAGLTTALPLPDEPPISPFSTINVAVKLMALKCDEVLLGSRISELVWARFPELLEARVTKIFDEERLRELRAVPYLIWITSSMMDIITAEAGDAFFPAQHLYLVWYNYLVVLRLKWDVSMLRAAIRRSIRNEKNAGQLLEQLLSVISDRWLAGNRARSVLAQIQTGPVPLPDAEQQLLSSSLAGHPHLLSISADLAASTPGTSGMGRASNDVYGAQTGGNLHDGRGSSSVHGVPPNNGVAIRQ
ncbi:hypothetical protein SeMB42_g07409 [Synchytrium endobioticum]|uniref:Uncharacterized protein n=1 Tax=Synchytrium endobioticum TaxID=286115 RepID=A0A507C3A9_9FUNG|nr:hypothetical protein SeMB42_g07409 [Synchytrium endobioticum]